MAVPSGSFESVEDVALVRRPLDGRIVPKGVVKDDGVKVLHSDARFFQIFTIFIPRNHFALPDWAAVETEPIFPIIAERAVNKDVK